MFLKPKEKLRIEEENDRIYLNANLELEEEDIDRIRDKSIDTYSTTESGELYQEQRNNGLINKIQGMTNSFSWFPKRTNQQPTHLDQKILDIGEKKLYLHTSEGILRSGGKENENTKTVWVNSEGNADFVNPFYKILKESKK